MPDASILTILEGSILVLRDIDFEPDQAGELAAALIRAAGHERFVVLHISTGGDTFVIGPDTDLTAALAEFGIPTKETPPCPTTS